MGAERAAAAFHHQAPYLTESAVINSAFYVPATAVSDVGNKVVCSNESCSGNGLFFSIKKRLMRTYVFLEARETPFYFYLFLSIQSLKLRVSGFWSVYWN